MSLRATILATVAIWPSVLLALDLALPQTAIETAARDSTQARYDAPVGPFAAGQLPLQSVDGTVRRTAWRIGTSGLTPVQLIAPMRRQLTEAGFEIVLDCADRACGGFDFRFALETFPAPAMFVNLRSFHFLTARKGPSDAPTEILTVLASTANAVSHVQIIHAGELSAPTRVATTTPAPQPTTATSDLGARLLQDGFVVLEQVAFAVGSVRLADTRMPDLAELAQFLQDRPDMRIALVGHTDTTGRLDANIDLSRRRAQSVKQRLVAAYDLEPGRIDVGGMGYLAPRASNLTVEGREANRRVEAIILPGSR